MNKTFWERNKVFILGLLSAIAVAITPFTQNADQSETVKWSAVGYAALVALLSYLASKWRGQGLSLVGIVGNASGIVATLLTSGTVIKDSSFILQLVLQLILTIIAAAAPDPKSVGYENTQTIIQAKREGEVIQPASLTKKV